MTHKDTRPCKTCGETKPNTAEHFPRSNGKYLKSTCWPCMKKKRAVGGEYHTAYSKRDTEKRRVWQSQYDAEIKRFAKYGVTRADYLVVKEFQDHKCALCREPFGDVDCVDHCHTTQHVRGILCQEYNTKFERENFSRAKQSMVPRYLSKPYIWEVALAVRAG